ncbi:hypothetical protein D3C72_1954060 [compost metagenome]
MACQFAGGSLPTGEGQFTGRALFGGRCRRMAGQWWAAGIGQTGIWLQALGQGLVHSGLGRAGRKRPRLVGGRG